MAPLVYLVDMESRTAALLGPAGRVHVVAHAGTALDNVSSLSFVEEVPSGAVQTTTIILSTGKAVHSRNTVMQGDFVPSQSLGSCVRS
ncbi:hypothetical protein SLNSH_02825 [Alsobacter soli]|uniref:Uncharacterized protein n=2 Tax=Alsobacter soli TaxID=2109933 RepID=A0A2T1HYH6_9HYPH|nr:hypothetical protein SLNSH_02825 [Alsobacter soli]